jgi:periplasmic divalent cation tolerance protein
VSSSGWTGRARLSCDDFEMSDEVVVVFSTFSTRDEAERIGEALVEQRLAACGNVIPTIHSFYFWEGKMQRESEALLLLKTTTPYVGQIAEFIKNEGTYDTPEVLAVKTAGGLETYLSWVAAEVGPAPGPA